MSEQVTIPRTVLEQTLSAIDWAADQIAPQSEEGCACPLCLVSPELERALVRQPDPGMDRLNAWAAGQLARHGIPTPCPVCWGVGYDSSGQRCEECANPSF